MLNVIYAECQLCRMSFMLNVIYAECVVMLNVVTPSDVMLNVVAPPKKIEYYIT